MSMIKKSITLTDQQDSWVKSQIDSGQFNDESEVIRELIQEKQILELETPEEIVAIRAALIEAEESVKREGYSKLTIDEIWEKAVTIHKNQNG